MEISQAVALTGQRRGALTAITSKVISLVSNHTPDRVHYAYIMLLR